MGFKQNEGGEDFVEFRRSILERDENKAAVVLRQRKRYECVENFGQGFERFEVEFKIVKIGFSSFSNRNLFTILNKYNKIF